ncbi:hypothetical protein [Kribbella sp. CA-247076]|uniref:hypothetical protein n=1 Tax=Kribbella sp. CA-247076 TaxID=3239941 RepID=UPI003D91B068
MEPQVTAQFLAALPPGSAPYQLDRRVKAPESLARKIRDSTSQRRRVPLDDVLRYTVLATSPDDLVSSARHTIDCLTDQDWRVTYAMHSYTDGSRYKGLHAYVAVPGVDRVEVQFHSPESVRIKEQTTAWYEIERGAGFSTDERAAARQKCIELSASLSEPAGIGRLTTLGGRPVAVNNYSDSRQQPPPAARLRTNEPHTVDQVSRMRTNDGMTR